MNPLRVLLLLALVGVSLGAFVHLTERELKDQVDKRYFFDNGHTVTLYCWSGGGGESCNNVLYNWAHEGTDNIFYTCDGGDSSDPTVVEIYSGNKWLVVGSGCTDCRSYGSCGGGSTCSGATLDVQNNGGAASLYTYPCRNLDCHLPGCSFVGGVCIFLPAFAVEGFWSPYETPELELGQLIVGEGFYPYGLFFYADDYNYKKKDVSAISTEATKMH